MFLKLMTLIIFGSYLAAYASLIIQDVDLDLTDVKEKLAKVESKLTEMKTEMVEMQQRLENLETDTSKGQTTQAFKSTTTCQDGWMAYKGSCYFFGTTEVTFTAAEERCRALGAHLVSVENQDENKFPKAFMLSHKNKSIRYWVGITDAETENAWKLTKGDTVATFFDWKKADQSQTAGHAKTAPFLQVHISTVGETSNALDQMLGTYVSKCKLEYIDAFLVNFFHHMKAPIA